MPEKMKLKYSGGRREGTPERSGGGGDYKPYEGPPLVPGVYEVRLKRMVHTAIKSEKNLGKDRFNLLLEVTGPDSQYVGAPIWEGVNAIEGYSAQICNEFLTALAGGPGNRADVVMDAFWNGELTIERKRSEGREDEVHVTKIGPLKIESPNGTATLKVSVREDKTSEKPRVKVTKWLPGSAGSSATTAPVAAAEPGGGASYDDDLLAALGGDSDRPF